MKILRSQLTEIHEVAHHSKRANNQGFSYYIYTQNPRSLLIFATLFISSIYFSISLKKSWARVLVFTLTLARNHEVYFLSSFLYICVYIYIHRFIHFGLFWQYRFIYLWTLIVVYLSSIYYYCNVYFICQIFSTRITRPTTSSQ